MDAFYLVWCPEGRTPPTHRHATRQEAIAEAERLARTAPLQEFFVLRAVCRSKRIDVMTTPLTTAEIDDDHIPF